MVITSGDAEYLAPFMVSSVENKPASIANETLGREDLRRDCRDIESLPKKNFVESRSELDSLDDQILRVGHAGKVLQRSLSMSGVENARSMHADVCGAEALDKRDRCLFVASNHHSLTRDGPTLIKEDKHKKKKGLLHRMRPRLSKADDAEKQVGGSIATTLTSKESYATEDDLLQAVGPLNRNLPVSVSGSYKQNKASLGRPPLPRGTFHSQREGSQHDDGTVSVSIKAAASDCEVEIENSDQRKSGNGMQDVNLADCVTEDSSVVTETRSIFGRNRPKKETIRQDYTDSQSVSKLSAGLMVSGLLQRKRHEMNRASLADCVTEDDSSVVTEKRSIFGRNRTRKKTNKQDDSDARSLPKLSASLATSKPLQRKRHDNDEHSLKKDVTVGSLRSMSDQGMKGVSLADCVTEDSSMVTEKRSILGSDRSRKETIRQDDADARSVATSSSSLLASEPLQQQRHGNDFKVQNDDGDEYTLKKDIIIGGSQSVSDHESKTVSLADYLSENSSAVTGKRGILGRNRSKKKTSRQEDADERSAPMSSASQLASVSLQRERKASNVVEKPEDESLTSLTVEIKSEIPFVTQSNAPKFLCPDNRLEQASSDITSSGMPAVAQDMTKSSPYCVIRKQERGHDQKYIPTSPISEALQFAKNQAGTLRSKFDEEGKPICRDGRKEAAFGSTREDETCPTHQIPMACGINDVMSMIDPEWEECDEFGKGKRNYQQADKGYTVSDVVQSLRAHFACDPFGDVVNNVDVEWKNRHRKQHDTEQIKETRKRVPIDFTGTTAKETATALRSLRHQLTCGIAGNVVFDAHSDQEKRDSIRFASGCSEEEKPLGDGITVSPFVSFSSRLESIESKPHSAGNSKKGEDCAKLKSRDGRCSLIEFREQGPKLEHLETQSFEERNTANTFKSETISVASSKDNVPPMLSDYDKGTSSKMRGGKKSNNDDESQMMSSFFSGDTPIMNNHTKDRTKAPLLNVLLRNNAGEEAAKLAVQATTGAKNSTVKKREDETKTAEERIRALRDAIITTQETTDAQYGAKQIFGTQTHVKRRVEQIVEEGDDDEEDDDEEQEEKEEEDSFCTTAMKESRDTKTPVNGRKKLSDVQLVLSASSTLELPKHKRNTVIRFASVPGDISYQQTGDTLQKEQLELERKKAQKRLQLAKRAVISSQYMDTLDPCFRVFDPALDACDKFCTQSPSEDSDDECSIASASVCGDKPSLGLRQRAQNYVMETSVWPWSGRRRKVKAPSRLA